MKNPYFNLIRALWHYGLPWRHTIIRYYLVYILAHAIRNLAPYAFGRTIDILQNFRPERLNEVVYWLSAGVGVIAVFWLLHGPTRVIERSIALKIKQAFDLNLYEKLTQLPLKWHQQHHSGNIVTRINRASDALYSFAEDQFIYIQAIVTFFTSVGFLFWLSPLIGLLSIVTAVLSLFTIIHFDRKLTRLYDAQNEIDNKVGAVLFDYLNNMTTVLTLRLGSLTHRNLVETMKTIWPFFKKDIAINEVKWFTMEMLLSAAQTMLLISYIVYSLRTIGVVKIGVVVMIFRYQWELSSVFYELSIHYGRLVHMNTDVQGAEPLLMDIKEQAHVPPGTEVARQWETIQITNLSFKHSQLTENKPIFTDLGFTLKRGEKIGLIGLSGGGKSTLLNLLGGLYTPTKVDLAIDGIRFNSLEPLRSIATLIPQDPEIFENTISFNITMGLPVNSEELDRIIRLAAFENVLERFPEGVNTYIYEKGLNLSVGQKQRLALARGLFAARFSSLILMDEPTSSLDLQTENEVLSGVIHAFPTSTIMISLHRLHLLPIFDRIIMLGKQGILADGPTTELLTNPGPVYEVWNKYQSQSQQTSK